MLEVSNELQREALPNAIVTQATVQTEIIKLITLWSQQPKQHWVDLRSRARTQAAHVLISAKSLSNWSREQTAVIASVVKEQEQNSPTPLSVSLVICCAQGEARTLRLFSFGPSANPALTRTR
jgi:hypothetical protein